MSRNTRQGAACVGFSDFRSSLVGLRFSILFLLNIERRLLALATTESKR